ncbi:hypothetical protein TNCV_4346781 [Trichonephila clavipes]|nr:hypothetical protein TNCV_4346781 [Trichonephila clavipes]
MNAAAKGVVRTLGGVTENIRGKHRSLQTQVLGPKPKYVLSQALGPLESLPSPAMWQLRGWKGMVLPQKDRATGIRSCSTIEREDCCIRYIAVAYRTASVAEIPVIVTHRTVRNRLFKGSSEAGLL